MKELKKLLMDMTNSMLEQGQSMKDLLGLVGNLMTRIELLEKK